MLGSGDRAQGVLGCLMVTLAFFSIGFVRSLLIGENILYALTMGLVTGAIGVVAVLIAALCKRYGD